MKSGKIKSFFWKVIGLYLKLRPKKTFWTVAVSFFLFLLGWIGNHVEQLVQFLNQQYGESVTLTEKIFWGTLTFWVSIDLPIWSVVFIIIVFLPFIYVYILELKIADGSNIKDLIASRFNSLSEEIDEEIDTKINEKIDKVKKEISFKTTDDWLESKCKLSIKELGGRYTSKLNVELEISKIFDGLGRTVEFQDEGLNVIDSFLQAGKKILNQTFEVENHSEQYKSQFNNLSDLLSELSFLGNSQIPVNAINNELNKVLETSIDIKVHLLQKESESKKETDKNVYQNEYSFEINDLRNFETEAYNLKSFFEAEAMELANNPILVLVGNAGIGKSHLVGDTVSKRLGKGLDNIFLLGQHFVTDEDPWTQIFKKLNIKTDSETFLTQLNKRAKEKNKKCIIFIDAINEGRGRYFWHNNIKGFIHEILNFEWLGLVLTVRSSYQKLLFPKEKFDDTKITIYRHPGFRNVQYEASREFFESYQIDLPSTPFLHPEFENPLFLKLFCEGLNKAGYNSIPEGFQGITHIIDFFIKSINQQLSKPDRLNYSESINLVRKSIDALISEKLNDSLEYIPYERAYEIVDGVAGNFINKKGFIDDLISEGVLSKNLYWIDNNKSNEGVYLAYERFEDHITANYLLEKYSDFSKEFDEGGALHKYVKDEEALYYNKGLIEAFSIQVPEKKEGLEFYDLASELKDKNPIIQSFIKSLVWRKTESITPSLLDYIDNYVLNDSETKDLFLETILSITSVPNHYFNAKYLHKNLLNQRLVNRDAEWTIEINNKLTNYSAVKRLIEWGWNENENAHLSSESVLLSSITLSWFLTSTNRELRDSATKSLISLLENRIAILIKLLMEFENVNDPYVFERIYAVAYGCTLRTSKKNELKKLAEYIFETIFKTSEEVYPHILLRDYARGIIEFVSQLGYDLSFDIKKAYPPYNSTFPDKLPTIEQIHKNYKLDSDSTTFQYYHWSQNYILDSMTTEYGRGTGLYGDFGRYVFQSALENWDLDCNELSNFAIELIFAKYGYDVKKFGHHDSSRSPHSRSRISSIERIGKKYQWLAFHEILARVADNYKMYEGWGNNRVETLYQGTWNPHVRDIDPTILIKKTAEYNNKTSSENWWSKVKYSNWDLSNSDWAKTKDDLPNFKNIIEVKDLKNDEWIMLEGHPSWSEPKPLGVEKYETAHKNLWTQIRCYLIKSEDLEKTNKCLNEQNFMGRWMPETTSRHELFSREYYWSSAFDFFSQKYYGGEKLRDIHDKKSGEFIAKTMIPCIDFLWEEEYDHSKEEAISYLKPNKIIFDGLNLKFSINEGEFIDSNGKMVCFDPSVKHNSKSYLLVRKQNLLDFLTEKNLSIVWTVLGEKIVIGGSSNNSEYIERLRINGNYFLNKKHELEGNIRTTSK